MLENLQKHSTPHAAFQPNSQVRKGVCLDRMGCLEKIGNRRCWIFHAYQKQYFLKLFLLQVFSY